jgi:hypothetical protein
MKPGSDQASPLSNAEECFTNDLAPERLQEWLRRHMIVVVLQLLLWTFALSNVLTSFAMPVNDFDDSIPLVHGMLVQAGRTPNLDFYSFYPPLAFYVNASLFSLFGRTVLAVRLFADVLYLLVLFSVISFVRARFPSACSLASAAALLVAAAIGNALPHPAWPGFAVSLLALLTYLNSQCSAQHRFPLIGVSGVLTGCALLYRINFGAYVAMVVVFDLLIPWLPRGGATRGLPRFKRDLLAATAFFSPLGIFCAAFCFLIYGRQTPATLFKLVFVGQQVMMIRFINLSFSSLVACAVSLPVGWFFLRMLLRADDTPTKAFLPVLTAVAVLSIALLGRAHFSIVPIVASLEIAAVICLYLFVHRLDRSELCLLLFFCGLVHYCVSRADFPHFRLLPIGAALFLPFLGLSPSHVSEPPSAPTPATGTAIAVLLTATFLCLASPDIRPAPQYIPKGILLWADFIRHPHMSDTDHLLSPSPPATAWLSVYPNVDELAALHYLRAQTTTADPIFVGLPDHSTIFANNLRMYFLADRPIGVRTFQLETRVATEPLVQQGIISDLEQNHVRWVAIDTIPRLVDPTFVAHAYVGSKLLDQYIAGHYHEVARFGPYVLLSTQTDDSLKPATSIHQ